MVSGWDCHGLPIEVKALQHASKRSKKEGQGSSAPPLSALDIRMEARKFAEVFFLFPPSPGSSLPQLPLPVLLCQSDFISVTCAKEAIEEQRDTIRRWCLLTDLDRIYRTIGWLACGFFFFFVSPLA